MKRDEEHHEQEPNVFKSAGAMGAATFLSRISGLLREEVVAFLFGAGNATDAFNVAFRIPNLLRDLFAEGAMSAALVPTFTQARVQEGNARAWKIAGRVFRVLFVVAAIIAAIGILIAPQLVTLYAGAFKEVPGKFELSVLLTRIMFPFFPLVALAAAFMAILNSCGAFFLPAFASALFNLTSVSIGVIFYFCSHRLGVEPIVGLGIGVVCGGAVQAFCQLPLLYRRGYRWKRREEEEGPWYRDPALKKMLWLMIPGTIGLGATQINILVNTMLATSQGTGAVSWLNYAFRLMQFPIGLFGVSIAAATLPKISAYRARKDHVGFANTLMKSLQVTIAINLFTSAVLFFLGRWIIQFLFQLGKFHASDTEATALALSAYAGGLVFYSMVKVLVPAFYALGNTKIPVISSVISVLATIILNLLMVGSFGYIGLALGTSIAAFLNSLFLLFAARKLIAEQNAAFRIAPIVKTFAVYLFISVLVGFGAQFVANILVAWFPADALGKWGVILIRGARLAVVLTLFSAVAAVLMKFFSPKEFSMIWTIVQKKLFKRRAV